MSSQSGSSIASSQLDRVLNSNHSLHSTSPRTPHSQRSTSPKVVIRNSSHPTTSPLPFRLAGKMADLKRSTRAKPVISYEISSESEIDDSSPVHESSFSSPERKGGKLNDPISVEMDETETEEEVIAPANIQPRRSSAGHSLRQRHELHQPSRVLEKGDNHGKRAGNKRRSKPKAKPKAKSTGRPPATRPSERSEIRRDISTITAKKRANFFIANKDLFFPLLPENNHIQRLLDQRKASQQDERDSSLPYKVLAKQPSGVCAEMKPYQLLGLSFLVYMNQNGMGGVLGDEMGLGKTLQTLSLIQYLKETKKRSTSSQLRPSLVVCPLSVLNSWMAEARKWTPGLKVLRFHGPMNERMRLKQIATGEIDFYGKETKASRDKKKARMTAKGVQIIDLESEDELLEDEVGVDLIVTTYEGYLAEQNWFKRAFVWNYVILDEGHKIKNDLSLISKALQGLGAEYRLILTGTPLQNNLSELWALLHWLYPEVFTEKTQDLFKQSFDLTKGQVSTKFMDSARLLLEVVMLRRMKNSPGVDLNLPPKTDVMLFVPLTPMQRFWYLRLLTKADKGLLDELFQGAGEKESIFQQEEAEKLGSLDGKSLVELQALDQSANSTAWSESKAIMQQAIDREQQDDSHKNSWRKLMNLLMQLRKCCNHPYILPHAEPDPYYLGEHVINASAKFIVLDKIVNELVVKQKRKIIIFSGFARMLDCCEEFLAIRGGTGDLFKYVRLDGGICRARRNLGIRLFNQETSDYRVILISTRAGGLGINLATASDVIILDQDWNPQIMLQAEARAHRIGQTKPVTVYKLCTQGTVEEQMMGRIQKKLYLSAKVTESMRDIRNPKPQKRGSKGSEADENMPQLNTGQLMSLVRRGAQTLARPEVDVNDMLRWDWATMLEKCKDKPADSLVSEETNSGSVKDEDEKQWLSQIEQVQSRLFDGMKHKMSESTADIAQEWTREERRIGKNTTVMVDGYPVSKESVGCAQWEAVATLAGKDPRLAEPIREKKAQIVNQEHCQVCWDGGDIVCCTLCPRSYHYGCLDSDTKKRTKGKMHFSCPQHQCVDCQQKTTDAGGMLYRCRWCERAYCEDCLDWEKTDLLGENLKEFELLSFPAVAQAYFIKCPDCTDHHNEDPSAHEFCQSRAQEIDEQYDEDVQRQEMLAVAAEDTNASVEPSSSPGELTEGPTLNSSGLSTPQFAPQRESSAAKSKRKWESMALDDDSPRKTYSKRAALSAQSDAKVANAYGM